MMKVALLVAALAACGGGGKKPAVKDPTPVETAKTEPPPEEKPADPPPPAEPSADALAQAALAEQYDAGKKLYTDKKCASCHGDNGEGNPKNPPVIGEKALPEKPPKGAKIRKTEFKTAGHVLAFIKGKMPLKSPGTLTDEEAAAVTAWILSETKVNITQKLDATNATSINLR